MTSNGKMRSALLRDELERVRVAIEGCKEDEAAALAEIRSLARAAVGPGPDGDEALKKCRAQEGKLGQARMGAKRLHDARLQIEGELVLALAEEDQRAREADAKEAEAFAKGLGDLFTEVDRFLAEFRKAYTACFASIREARLRGWPVPSEELMTSKMYRALKTAFSVGELRSFDMSPLPAPERCTFNSIGESYAMAIRGGVKHAVKPVPPPIATPTPAARADDRKLPPRGDVGMRFKDDPREFSIREIPGR